MRRTARSRRLVPSAKGSHSLSICNGNPLIQHNFLDLLAGMLYVGGVRGIRTPLLVVAGASPWQASYRSRLPRLPCFLTLPPISETHEASASWAKALHFSPKTIEKVVG